MLSCDRELGIRDDEGDDRGTNRGDWESEQIAGWEEASTKRWVVGGLENKAGADEGEGKTVWIRSAVRY